MFLGLDQSPWFKLGWGTCGPPHVTEWQFLRAPAIIAYVEGYRSCGPVPSGTWIAPVLRLCCSHQSVDSCSPHSSLHFKVMIWKYFGRYLMLLFLNYSDACILISCFVFWFFLQFTNNKFKKKIELQVLSHVLLYTAFMWCPIWNVS